MTGVRVRSAVFVVLMVAALGGLSGFAAAAEPRTVTVAVHDLEPFVVTNGTVKSGFTIELLEAVAKQKGWTLDFVNVENVAAQLKAVTEGRVDAAATAISITADRAKNYDFSQPILNSGLQIAVPTSQLERKAPGIADFLGLLFSKTMLIWLAAGVILSVIPAHIVWFSERGHGHAMVSRSYFPGIFQALGWSLGMLAGQPDSMPRHTLTRGLAVLWAFVGLIFVAYYTATLTTNLTVERFSDQINAPSDLVGKRVCTVADTNSSSYLRSIGVQANAVAAIDDCYATLKRGELDAAVFDSPVLRYFVAHEGAGFAQIVGTIFDPEDYGVAFPNGSDLRKQFDEGLLSIREDGTFSLIKQKWFGFEEPDPGDEPG